MIHKPSNDGLIQLKRESFLFVFQDIKKTINLHLPLPEVLSCDKAVTVYGQKSSILIIIDG